MRVPFIASALLLTALAGCAELPQLDLAEMQPYPDASYAPNSTAPAEPVPEPSVVPVVTSVATTPYTAPVPISLAESDDLALVAGPDGLWCTSRIADPYAAPAGYKVVATHAACRLIAGNTTFAEASAGEADVDLPLMSEVPVDEFRFEMEVTRTLVNNTGSHEDVLAEYEGTVLAAPSGWVEPRLPYGLWYGEVCDAPDEREDQSGPVGVETITFTAYGHNGRPSIIFDASQFDVVDVQGGNMTNGTIVAVGEWAHESLLELAITIDFESSGEEIALIPGCNGTAFQFDYQELPVTTITEGIAAGWQDVQEEMAWVEVYLQLV